ncbi:MAG: 3-deoxy-manno-octulosonate cytidylyltransferase [Lentisphaeria bacterium]|jgi:3-deoxy-manno-octulosonate cytidylyltransferase (CMP-KDO synthetase)
MSAATPPDRVVAVIPARYGSSRFPGKPLALIAGKSMIQRVVERARSATLVDEVLVATDDERISRAVEAFGGRAVMTSPEHPSGTDRIAAAVRGVSAGLVLNLQGDEPLLPGRVIDELVRQMRSSRAEMGTVAVPLAPGSPEFANPNVVKVVVNAAGDALYFSRAGIPFQRTDGEPAGALWHWGVYAYRREFLERFVGWPPSRLERCEKLEQLRALEHGARIRVLVETEARSTGVDTPEDVARVEALLRELGEA